MKTNGSTDSDRPLVSSHGTTMRSIVATTAAAVLCLIGGAAIVGWATPSATPARQAQARPVSPSGIETRDVKQDFAELGSGNTGNAQPSGKSRRRINCADCGVIESIRRIDKREEILGSCNIGDSPTNSLSNSLADDPQRTDLVTLSDTVNAALSGNRVGKRIHVVTRHQIVVRFRDGSRRVFNEETPRMLQVGEGVRVIAGVSTPRG